MSAPVVLGRNTAAYTTATTSVVVAFDTTPTVGELLFVTFLYSSVTNTVTVGSGTGWTKVDGQSANGGNPSVCFFYKVADGTGDNLTVSMSTSARGAYTARRISGGSTYAAVSLANGPSVTGGAVDPPPVSPGVGSKDFLFIAGLGNASTTVATAAPAGYSNFSTVAVTGTSQVMATAEKTALGVSSEDPGTWSGPVAPYVTWTIAIYGPPGSTMAASTGAFALAGTTVALASSRTVTAATGTFALTGADTALIRSGPPVLTAAPGAFALSGSAVMMSAPRRLSASAGSFSMTGRAVTLTLTEASLWQIIPRVAGVWRLSGDTEALSFTAGSGSFALTGLSLSVALGISLAAGVGGFTLAGSDATLSSGPSADPGYVLLVDSDGAYLTDVDGAYLEDLA